MTTPEIYFTLSFISVQFAFAIMLYPKHITSFADGNLYGYEVDLGFRLYAIYLLCSSILLNTYMLVTNI